MNDGVVIIGLPQTEADATTGTAEAASPPRATTALMRQDVPILCSPRNQEHP
ncbi:hypothetical protein P5P81_13250 [Tritonibacter mobilis]|nr:hypothetical protein [Tritonibacter mobilis]